MFNLYATELTSDVHNAHHSRRTERIFGACDCTYCSVLRAFVPALTIHVLINLRLVNGFIIVVSQIVLNQLVIL